MTPSRLLSSSRSYRVSLLTLATATLLSLSAFSDGAQSHALLGNLKYNADISSPTDVDFYRATLMAGDRGDRSPGRSSWCVRRW